MTEAELQKLKTDVKKIEANMAKIETDLDTVRISPEFAYQFDKLKALLDQATQCLGGILSHADHSIAGP